MANPTKFTRSFNFSSFQAYQPWTPLPAESLDIELANISTSTESLRDAIMDVRRSDGALQNGIVTADSLRSE